MKKTGNRLLVSLVLLCLLLGFLPPAARAANAATVWVDGVVLSATAPYWQNGSGTASAAPPAGGWNAYFDAATSTLTLADAVLDSPVDIPGFGSGLGFVYADGDLHIVLEGASTFTYSGSHAAGIAGVYLEADLTVNGSGSLDIDITKTDDASDNFALINNGNLTLYQANLTIRIVGGSQNDALLASGDLLYISGATTIYTSAPSCSAFHISRSFRMTGGSISAQCVATGRNAFLFAVENLYLEGGTGTFRATGEGNRYAGAAENDIVVTGGHFTFAGETSALFNHGHSPYLDVSAVYTYTSEQFSGSGKRLWTSAADGELAKTQSVASAFQFVEFSAVPLVLTPQTGDGQTPLLWAGIALIGLCLIAGMIPVMRKGRIL